MSIKWSLILIIFIKTTNILYLSIYIYLFQPYYLIIIHLYLKYSIVYFVQFQFQNAWLGLHNYFSGEPSTRPVSAGNWNEFILILATPLWFYCRFWYKWDSLPDLNFALLGIMGMIACFRNGNIHCHSLYITGVLLYFRYGWLIIKLNGWNK